MCTGYLKVAVVLPVTTCEGVLSSYAVFNIFLNCVVLCVATSRLIK
jgi:hypothetical protein